MRGVPEKDATGTLYTHAPATAYAAEQTVAANANHTHVLDWIHYSFDQAPDSKESLRVLIGGTVVFLWYVTAAGPGFCEFPGGLYGSKNQALKVTLSADSAGAVCKVNFKVR